MSDMIDKGRLWLFTNTYKKTENHPAFTGSGEISVDVLKRLVAEAKANPPADGIIKLQAAAWEKTSQAGKPYLFTTFDLKQEYDPDGTGQKSDGGSKDTGDNTATKEEDIPW
jgi:hypothetical protein